MQENNELGSILISHERNIQDANVRSVRLYHSFSVQSQAAFWGTTILFGIVAITAIGLILAGLYLAFDDKSGTFKHFFSIGISILGVLLLLILLFTNPIRLARKSVTDTVKINLIFTGYTRQIYQIDTAFKRLITRTSFTSEEVQQLSEQNQTLLEKALDTLSSALDDSLE